MWAIYPGRNLNNEWDIVKTLKKTYIIVENKNTKQLILLD